MSLEDPFVTINTDRTIIGNLGIVGGVGEGCDIRHLWSVWIEGEGGEVE